MGTRGQILIGKNNNTLSVDFDSIILTLSTDNIDNTLNQIKNTYYPYMAKLLKNNNIHNFNRIGMMFDHQVDELKIINEIVGNLSSSKITSPDNLQLRFSKKLPDVMSSIKKTLLIITMRYLYTKKFRWIKFQVRLSGLFSSRNIKHC